jgi:hypothetical protein
MSQSKRIEGVRTNCPCCDVELLLTDSLELIALGLPPEEAEQVSTGIKTVESSPGWNTYYDPTHIPHKPILQPPPAAAYPNNTEHVSEVSKPDLVGAGDVDPQILAVARQDLVQRGIVPVTSDQPGAPSPGPVQPAMSPRFRSKLARARAAWLDNN